MDGGAWWATVHGITKSQARLSDYTHRLAGSWEGGDGGRKELQPLFFLFSSFPLLSLQEERKIKLRLLGA